MTNPYGWARTTPANKVAPPEAKKNNGWNANEPAAAQYLNHWMDGVAAGAALDRERLLLSLPLINSLAMDKGVGSVAFARSTTGTYIDRYGVLQTAAINEPRFEKNGLLIEGASTNLLPRSEEFDNAAWGKIGTTVVTADDIAAPDESVTADKIDDQDAGSASYVQEGETVADDSEAHTFSVFLKQGTAAITQIGLSYTGGSSVDGRISLTWATLAITESGPVDTFTIEILADGWVRLTIVVSNNGSGNTSSQARIYPAGQTLADTGTVYAWGAQQEKLPLASSYIPTAGSTVTRTAENCEVTIEGNVPLQADPAAIICDVSILGNIGGSDLQTAVDINGEGNRRIFANNGGDNKPRFQWGSVGSFSGTVTVASNTIFRQGMAFGGGSTFTGWTDGINVGSDAVVDVSDPLGTEIQIGSDGGSRYLYGHITNVRIYDRAPTDEEMAFLTYRGAS